MDDKEYMLTTIDNPFNPFTEWDAWKGFDEAKGYHTCSYLARIAATTIEDTESNYDLSINLAIDEIVKLNINGMYKKVYEDEIVTDRGGGCLNITHPLISRDS